MSRQGFLLAGAMLLASHAFSADADLERDFRNPPAEYRSMPLWVWNDELSWPRLQEQLEQFRAQGMGGVFVHPRPGLMTEYLGADWFRFWKSSVDAGKRLGLLVNIYDENSYPAGFAGGHVPARAPDTAAQFVQAVWDAGPGSIAAPGVTVSAFAAIQDAEGHVTFAERIHRAGELAGGRRLLVFRLRRASGNPWTAGFPYVDLTNPQTAPLFLETTYEVYKQHLGQEFGKTIRWAFNDEPLLATAGAYDSAALALPLSYTILAEFQKRCGYDLADRLPSLYWDVGDFRRVRFDYWQTLHDLWKENYFQPLYQWCDRNGLQFTGHWMEHEWPYPWISPDDASMYAFEHMPGIDMLEGSNIRTKGVDPHMLFTIKQVASVAHQLGRRAFCEAYGVSGWDSTLEHYKRFGDWLMVHGVNFVDQHLAFATVRGARKRDHPQSFTDVSAWWPYYRTHGDHLARVSYLLTRGRPHNRLLLLEATTSGFLWARRGGATPELERMRRDNAELIQALADRQVDFDLGDEYILEWHGKADGARLAVGNARYDLLVWPANMVNLRSQTLPLLEKYLAGGGHVLGLAAPAAYVDGRPNGQPAALAARYAGQWHQVSGADALIEEARKRLPARVTFESALPPGVGLLERELENGDRLLFLANTGLAPVKTNAMTDGGGLEEWDTSAGSVSPARFEPVSAGRIRFPIDLAPAGSTLLRITRSGKPRPPVQEDTVVISPRSWQVTPDALNVLPLDYCDLTVAGVEHRNIHTWKANWEIWQQHGFERPAWDNAVQYRTRVFDRNHFGPDSGFEARFAFEIASADALPGLELAVEVPELYHVTVNGRAVSFTGAARWLDPHLRSISIESLTRVGENEIVVSGRPFDVRMEFENVYLRGRFSVKAASRGFRLEAAQRLSYGSWAKQGYPFYSDAVLYQTDLDVPAGRGRLEVSLGEWQGSVVEVLLDGRRAAVLGWPPYRAVFPAGPGHHSIGIRVVATPRNLFGPFHNSTKPRMRAWPAAWADFPDHQPPGEAYDLLDYGMTAPPRIRAIREHL